MKSALDLNIRGKNTLVVGKGPSVDLFKKFTDYDYVFTINQATNLVPIAHFAFFLDLEPFLEVLETVLQNENIKVILPLYANVRNSKNQVRRSDKSLMKLKSTISEIENLIEQDRLFYYNTEVANYGVSSNNLETFSANFVSVTVLTQILQANKCSRISLVGFDGGNEYSSGLPKSQVRPLTASFNKQFEILKASIKKISLF